MQRTIAFFRQGSIRKRFFLACVTVLPLFLGLLGTLLDNIHQQSLVRSAHASLQLHVHTLIAEAEPELTDMSVNGERRVLVRMPEQLIDPDLNITTSDIQGFILGKGGTLLWQSPSASIRDLSERLPNFPEAPGEFAFMEYYPDRTHPGFFIASLRTVFEMEAREVSLTFVIAKSLRSFAREMRAYRSSLALSLSLIGILLAGSLLLIVSWGLKPLDQLAEDISRLESGEIGHLAPNYPQELKKVTQNLNQLIDSENRQRERYRNTLSDLAHSLKTPLAVSQGLITELTTHERAGMELAEQIGRMNQIIQYQLQRATSAKPALGRQSTALKPVVSRLSQALAKVYFDKNMHSDIDIPDNAQAPLEERDLTEVLGNLIDNACKYGHKKYRVSNNERDKLFQLVVENDGKQVPQNLKTEILKRGARADTAISGQGIGLAVVTDIVSNYGGAIRVEDSELGGAKILIEIPL